MSQCNHQNFAIDAEVDKQVQQNFEELVEEQIARLPPKHHLLDEDSKRKVAIGLILIKKEKYKLEKKRKAAKRLKRKPLKERDCENQEESLLKHCLLKMHKERRKREKRIKMANEEMELHRRAQLLEEQLYELLQN
nr:PREDICTED: uncharacterized protein LOC103314808 [Tribolium castaneum]|eukprot:XP_008199979.1 PREDICTED: uncharacterized protein LOC103314808 [Tribolium castaneum]